MLRKIFLLIALLISTGCSSSDSQKVKILVTIPPYAGFAKHLTNSQVQVEIFVPPGSDPHTYEPTPEQVKQFTQAKVWFRIGDPIETKMVSFLSRYNILMINLSEEEKDPLHHDHTDLHLWMNPLLLLKQIQEMTDVLSQQFPALASQIKQNGQKICEQLKLLDHETSQKLAPFQNQYLLISHPALGYYCSRYHLQQLSIEVEGKDSRPQDIATLMTTLKEHPVPVVFIEPQYNKKGALLLAKKLHIPTEEINPYDEDYFKMFNHLTDTIVKYYVHPH